MISEESIPPLITGEGEGPKPPVHTTLFTPEFASILDYFLKLDVPKEYHHEIEKLAPLLTKLPTLAYMPEDKAEMLTVRWKKFFEQAMNFYRMHEPVSAREYVRELVFELLLSRSRGGFQQLVFFTARSEQLIGVPKLPTMPQMEAPKKKSFWSWRK